MSVSTFYARYNGLVTQATGVTSLDGMTGALTLVAGTGITIVDGAGTITISNSESAFTPGNLTDAGTDGITITGGTNAVNGSGTSIAQHVADTTHNGYLSSTNWNTFNSKQPAGSYITALTGDVTASGPGSAAASLIAVTNATLTTLSALTTATSLSGIGTITTGVWHGTAIAPTYGGASPVTKVLYVDNGRTDTYTATGSMTLPFKTIGAAITQIITNGDNSTVAYSVSIAPGAYPETLTLNSSTLYSIVFKAVFAPDGGAALQNTTISGITSTANNTQLTNLAFDGLSIGAISMTGDTNGTNFGATQILFVGCQFNNGSNAINFTNVNNINLYNCTIQGTGTVTFDNVAFGYIEGAEGLQTGTTLALINNNAGNQPSQFSGNYVLISGSKLYGTCTVDAGSELDLLQTYTGSSSSVTNNGTIHSWAVNWGGTVTLNNGSTLRTQGDSFKNAPTVNAGAAFTYIDTGYNGTQVAHSFQSTGATSGTVSILPQAAAGTYNFNLPTTAGSSGQVLTSAGGGSSPMTWTSASSFAITSLTGDVTGTGPGATATTLATVNTNTGSFGSSTAIPSFTVNGKGLITAASTNAVIAPAGTLTGTTLASNVVTSSLTTVGTIGTGVWHGTAVDPTFGGTGQTAYTTGDILYASATNTLSRLPIGSTGQALVVTGGVPVWGTAGTSSPLTTKGDIYTYSTTNARQPVPGDNGLLVPDSLQATGWRSASYTQYLNGRPGKNYIQYADFENNSTTGWSLGTIGTLTNGLPTGSPTFGSGASGNLSIAASSSNIEGAYSMTYVSSAATTVGNMVATSSYGIDIEDQAKVLTVKFYYQATSGAANCNFSGTSSNSFAWAIYDVTNSSWLTSAGNFNLVQSTGCGYVTGTVQTNATTANIRLVVYNANATSGAATLTLDGFYVGPQTAPSGPAMTDWVAYTPTLTTSGGGNITLNASSVVSPTGFYRRAGDSAEIFATFANGSGGGASGNNGSIIISLPSGLSADTTKMVQGTGFSYAQGSGEFRGGASGNTYEAVDTASYNSSNVGISLIKSTTNGGTIGAFYAVSDLTASAALYIRVKIPITGWSSNTSMSSDTDTRIVSFSAYNNAGSATANTAITTGWNTIKDTAGAFSSGTYTVPVSGDYYVSWAAATTSGTPQGAIYKNGSVYLVGMTAGGSETRTTVNTLISGLKAGDTLTVVLQTTLTLTTSTTDSIFAIQRLSGPAVVQATESVNGRYFSSTTSISGSLATVIYATKGWDTHNAYNASTGVWTAPVSGKYQFNANIDIAGTFVLNSTVDMQVQQSGSSSQISETQNYAFASATDIPALVADKFYCLAGDTIKVQVSSSATGPSIVSSNSKNYFSWSRVGN